MINGILEKERDGAVGGDLMGEVNVIPLVDEELGNSAYLVDLADGRALAGLVGDLRGRAHGVAVIAGGPQDWAGSTGQPLPVTS